jgi:hypothetical protein
MTIVVLVVVVVVVVVIVLVVVVIVVVVVVVIVVVFHRCHRRPMPHRHHHLVACCLSGATSLCSRCHPCCLTVAVIVDDATKAHHCHRHCPRHSPPVNCAPPTIAVTAVDFYLFLLCLQHSVSAMVL